jgi:uncharacterized protein (TIGR03437 family)
MGQMHTQGATGVRIFIPICDAFPTCNSSASWDPSQTTTQQTWITNIGNFFQDVANAGIANVTITLTNSGPYPAEAAGSTSSPNGSCSVSGKCCDDIGMNVLFDPAMPFGLSDGTVTGTTEYFPLGDFWVTFTNNGYNCAPINNYNFIGWTNYYNVISAILAKASGVVTVFGLEIAQELNPTVFNAHMRWFYDNSSPSTAPSQYVETVGGVTYANVLGMLRSLMGTNSGRVEYSAPWTDASSATENSTARTLCWRTPAARPCPRRPPGFRSRRRRDKTRALRLRLPGRQAVHSERRAGSGIRDIAACIAIAAAAAWSQTPVVSSVVDAASYEPTLGASGAIATIFGTNLAAAAVTAQTLPLPRSLGGTSVTWNGVAAPIFYVSPTQINFQVPTPDDETPGVLVVAGVVVSTAAGNSAPYNPAGGDAWLAGGIFSLNASGCGSGAILNVASDGSVSVNSTSNSARPGEWISVYGTNLASFDAQQFPPDGTPSPSIPLEEGNLGVGVAFDLAQPANFVSASWTGLAPGLVGVDQFNVQIPASVREGCAVPLQAAYYGYTNGITQPVTVAIQNGGGPCVDPPAAGYGQITWQKTVAETQAPPNSGQTSLTSESDTITVSLQSSPGQQPPPTPVFGQGVPSSITYSGPACSVAGYISLGAGTVSAQGPSLSGTLIPSVPFQQGQLALPFTHKRLRDTCQSASLESRSANPSHISRS